MNAIKQQQNARSNLFSANDRTSDLTQQERRALSLVWLDEESEMMKTSRKDPVTEHCAVLGYN